MEHANSAPTTIALKMTPTITARSVNAVSKNVLEVFNVLDCSKMAAVKNVQITHVLRLGIE